MKRIWASLGLA